ncbi:Para-nitrobenzyl esterase [compost metagenome]
MQDAWIAFAKAGKPVVAEIEWPEYRQNRATLIFNHEIEVVRDPEASKRELLGVK